MEAERILFILLSIVLIVLLIILIAVTVLIFQLIKRFKHVADTADKTIQNFSSASRIVKNAATPTAVTTIISSFYNNFIKPSKSSKKGKKK